MTPPQLTAVELGKLWTTYLGNSMSLQILPLFLQHVEDESIQNILNQALSSASSMTATITSLFEEESVPIPIGFTPEDTDLGTSRLFHDVFYLHYLKQVTKAGLSLYSIAVPLVSRPDVCQFFTDALFSTTNLINQTNDVLLLCSDAWLPPNIPIPLRVEFVQKQQYLGRFFGNNRPLNALEITHLFDNLLNHVTSKALLLGFLQSARDESVKKFFLRGKELIHKQIEAFSSVLHHDDLPSPPLLDDLVTDAKVTAISDKLMLFHTMDLFAMKIREYGNSLSVCSRRDLGAKYARFTAEIAAFVEDGANLMIDCGWLEKPPQSANREALTH